MSMGKLFSSTISVALYGCVFAAAFSTWFGAAAKDAKQYGHFPDTSRVLVEFPLLMGKSAEVDPETGNKFVSTVSTTITMAILYLAAAGQTAEEIRKAMHMANVSDPAAMEVYLKLREAMTIPAGIPDGDFASETSHDSDANEVIPKIVQAGTKVLIKKDMQPETGNRFAKDFKAMSELLFASVDYVPTFDEGTRREINEWVERVTDGEIRELFKPGTMQEDQVAVVVNAIRLQAQWQFPFNREMTTKMNFYAGGRSGQHRLVQVDAMRAVDIPCRYTELRLPGVVHAVELALTVPLVKVLILAPADETSDIDMIEKEMTLARFQEIHVKLETREDVRLMLPKVAIEGSISMKGTFEKLGIQDLFRNGRANLPGLTGRMEDRSIYVSDIFQNSVLKWNETGMMAASATGVSLVAMSGRMKDIRVDRPFLVYISYFGTNNIQPDMLMFTGRIGNPEAP